VLVSVQWIRLQAAKSAEQPLNGSIVQRLQRFATYGTLKQQVLRIITDELAIGNERGQDALKKVRTFRFALNVVFVMLTFFFLCVCHWRVRELAIGNKRGRTQQSGCDAMQTIL
jgi:hypothetical protein